MDDHEACLKSIKAHARKFGFALNPDHATVMRVVCGLLKNKKKYGHYYCPCKVVTGADDVDRFNECPCAYHEADVALEGRCHCNLYLKGA